jgi:hypothetical protein
MPKKIGIAGNKVKSEVFLPQSPAGLRPLAFAPLSVFRGFATKDSLRAAPLGAGSR